MRETTVEVDAAEDADYKADDDESDAEGHDDSKE